MVSGRSNAGILQVSAASVPERKGSAAGTGIQLVVLVSMVAFMGGASFLRDWRTPMSARRAAKGKWESHSPIRLPGVLRKESRVFHKGRSGRPNG
jgi:hypothetical protein